ncbi:MAG: helix-turn-helix transcriptional regulator, partial [Firmicutes bacterium]|nr:helix-turn-helix transcriptional regulator [Bacillota bacterium]
SKSVAEIAAECGYSDQSYFSRAFQKQYGTTPLEYRKAGLSGLKAG